MRVLSARRFSSAKRMPIPRSSKSEDALSMKEMTASVSLELTGPNAPSSETMPSPSTRGSRKMSR